MKKYICLLLPFLITASPFTSSGANLYWDLNGNTPGASPVPDGTWDSGTPNWNTDPAGVGDPLTLVPWTAGDTAFFSAGTDAVGPFTVTISAQQTAAGVTVEEGTVLFRSGTAQIADGGVVAVNAGATLDIDNFARLGTIAGTGSKVLLNGGTLLQSNPGSAGAFLSANFNIEIGPLGGTVNYTSSGTGTISIYGGATGTITGTGTLTKNGPGEFRYQGNGLNSTTYTKLVVSQGLFRLGFNQGVQNEQGFGAVPAAFTPDAITLSGGGSIATSFLAVNSVLHANRGITLGAGGGVLLGPLTVPGVITGTGGLSSNASNLNPVVLPAANTYTGPTTLNTGILRVTSLANGGLPSSIGASSNSAANLVFNGSTTLLYDGPTASTDRSFTITDGATANFNIVANALTISGSTPATTGALTKIGAGTLTLNGANTHTGATTVLAGSLIVGGSLAGTGSVSVGNPASAGATALLGGSGTVGNVTTAGSGDPATTGATIDPGNSPNVAGILKTGTLSISGGAHLSLQIGGTVAGGELPTGYDQVVASGAVSLTGGDLKLTLSGSPVFNDGDVLFLIVNNSGSALTGTFATVNGGAYDPSNIVLGGQQFQLNYGANFSGPGSDAMANDLSLTAIPEPSVVSALLAGIGTLVAFRRRAPRRQS